MYIVNGEYIYNDQAAGIIEANEFYLAAAEAAADPEECYKWLSKCTFLIGSKVFQN